MLMKWILQGTRNVSDQRSTEIERASVRLSQNVMYETKSDRQVSYKTKSDGKNFKHSRHSENEQVVAVAIKAHSFTRSKHLVKYLHRNGHCIDYSRLLRLENEIASSIMKDMKSPNDGSAQLYVPPKLIISIPVFYAVDKLITSTLTRTRQMASTPCTEQ